MGTTDRRIAQLTFTSVHPLYVAKVKRKGGLRRNFFK